MHEPAGVVEILVQILPEYPYSEFQNPPSPENENCQRVQIREFQNTPSPPENENCQSPNPRVSEYPSPLKMKIVRESKSESFRISPLPKYENCQSPNPRVSEYPPPPNFRIVLQPGRSYVETNL